MRDEIKALFLYFIPHPSSLIPSFLEEGVGVEPTGVFRLRRFSGPLGVAHAQPSARESGRGDTTRTCIVLKWTRVWSPLHCQLCYAPLLVHAAGFEPAVSHSVILIYSQAPAPLRLRMRN